MEEYFISYPVTAAEIFRAGAEGPACDAAGNLYAVNMGRDGTIGRVTPSGNTEILLELPNRSIGNGIRFDRAGQMYVADYANHNVLVVDMVTRERGVFAHDDSLSQPNDIAIDRDNTIFASDPDWADGSGQMLRVDAGEFVPLEQGMGTTNGIEVDMTRRLLYVNETFQRRIWVYNLLDGGVLTNKRLFREFSDHGLDGMRCDVAGNLYVTRWGKGTVLVIAPDGRELQEVEVGGHKCTNLAFGGPDGRTCYVTIADIGRIDAFRTGSPGQSWQLQRDAEESSAHVSPS